MSVLLRGFGYVVALALWSMSVSSIANAQTVPASSPPNIMVPAGSTVMNRTDYNITQDFVFGSTYLFRFSGVGASLLNYARLDVNQWAIDFFGSEKASLTNHGEIYAHGTNASDYAVLLFPGTSSSFFVENYGLISANGGSGIFASSDSDVSVVNHGVITSSTATAIWSSISGNHNFVVRNDGVVSSPLGAAIFATVVSSSPGIISITNENNGQIIGGGGTAIDVSGALGRTVTLTMNGGKITGDVKGNGAGSTLNYQAGVIQGAISGIHTFNVLAGNFQNAFLISDLANLTISTGAQFTKAENASNFSAVHVDNFGILDLSTYVVTVQDYVQRETAALALRLTNATTGGQLNATTASFSGGVVVLNYDVANASLFTALSNYSAVNAGVPSGFDRVRVVGSDPYQNFVINASGNVSYAGVATVEQAKNNMLQRAGLMSEQAFAQAAGGGVAGANASRVMDAMSASLAALHDSDPASYQSMVNALNAKSGAEFARSVGQVGMDMSVASGFVSSMQGMTQNAFAVISDQLSHANAGLSMSSAFGALTSASNAQAASGISSGSAAELPYSAWIRPSVSRLNQEARDGFQGFIAKSNSVLLGADRELAEDVRAGLAVGYGDTKVDGGSGSSMRADHYRFALFTRYQPDPYFVEGQVSVAKSDVETARYVGLTDSVARGDFTAWEYAGRVNAGVNLTHSGTILTPSVGLQYSKLNQGNYTESGAGPFSLRVMNANPQSIVASTGFEVSHPIRISGDGVFKPGARIVYSHDFGDVRTHMRGAFANSGVSFSANSPTGDRDALTLGGELGYHWAERYHLLFASNCILRETSRAFESLLQLKIDF